MLYWPLVNFVTTTLYILMLITLPFSRIYSAVFLFALIGFWSRLPGVAIPSPLYILYLADFIDFFTVIITIHLGPMEGAVFSFSLNIVSRMCGNFPYWMGVIKDSAAQAIACFAVPLIYSLSGGNIVMTMTIYTVLRALLFFPMRIIPDGTSWVYFIFYDMIGATIAMTGINIFYAKIFGSYIDSLLQQGLKFNWMFFLIITAIIYVLRKKAAKQTEQRFKSIPSQIFEISSLFIKRFLTKKEDKKKRQSSYNEQEMMEIKQAVVGYDNNKKWN